MHNDMHYCTTPVNALMQHDAPQACTYGSGMPDNWTIEYLRHVMTERDLTASGLASAAGVSSTTLTRPLNSREHKFEISRRTLDKIQSATGVPYHSFMPGAEAGIVCAPPEEGDDRDGSAMIDLHDVRASAGFGALIDAEEVVDRLSFPLGYLGRLTKTHPRHLAIIGVQGESMEPTIRDDDVVMLDTTKTNLDYDGLFVLRFGDALHVKRVSRASADTVLVISDNAAYPPRELPRSDIHVIGKVIWMGKKM